MTLPETFEPELRLPNAAPLTPIQHDDNWRLLITLFGNLFTAVPGANLTDLNRMVAMLISPASMVFVHIGTIADIKPGFQLCDGSGYSTALGNGNVPDLRNQFIIGADADDGGVAKSTITGAALQQGGSISHTHGAGSLAVPNHDPITESNLPLYDPSQGGAYTKLVRTDTNTQDGSPNATPGEVDLLSASSPVPTYGTSSPSELDHDSLTGSVASSSHIPVFYALAFVTYVGV